jgi:endoglucanase
VLEEKECDRRMNTTDEHAPSTRRSAPPLKRLVCVVGLALIACDRSGTAVSPDSTNPPVVAARPLPDLGRGVNFGNTLEASPREGDWGLRVSDELFDRARESGAQTIRLPVRFSNYAGVTPPFMLNDSILARVQYAIDAAVSRDMNVVVDLHHYRQLSGESLDPGEPRVDSALVEDRFVAIWRQVAERFRTAPRDRVAFELLNEPNGSMTAQRWNALLRRALTAIRETNPERWVVVGPVEWNSASRLPELSVPADPRLIVTIHNYEPFSFTHQGAEWVQGADAWLGTGCCDAAQVAAIRRPLDQAAQWNATQQRPMWVGEFGAYSRADRTSRVQFTRQMRDEIERRGFAWAYWEFAAGFGFYDPSTRSFRTELRNALFGPN